MKVQLKLFASLEDCLPAGAKKNTVALTVVNTSTPLQIIDAHHIPRDSAHLVLLNGVYIDPEDRDKPIIKDGDVLAIWPPVAGG